MSAMTAQEYMDIGNNGLSSSLPLALQYLTNLQYLDVSMQRDPALVKSKTRTPGTGLNGTLPSEYSSLTALT